VTHMIKAITILIYVSSVIAVLVVGVLVSSVINLYPVSHLGSFGPVVPAISKTHAAWLPAVPMLTWAIATSGVAAGFVLWRSRQAVASRIQVALLIRALNYFLALFFTTTLLVAYFYLPKIANAA
jgi:hypothetical protein